jgi:magnesium transporter
LRATGRGVRSRGDERMTITTRLYCEGKLDQTDFDPSTVDEVLGRPNSLVWLDIDEPTKEKMDMLREEFDFHPLALEDCLHEHQRPKVERYDTYFFLVAYGITLEDGRLVPHEMGIFVGPNYLVTVRKPPAFDLTHVIQRWDGRAELVTEGGGYLLYILLDEIVDHYFDVLDAYEDRTEDVEDRVFEATGDSATQSHIFGLKKDLLEFRRAVSPMREVLDVLQGQNVEVVTARLAPYYRDVYDHVLRATDFIDTMRDILTSALDANLSVISNRLNEVMKQLTSWAAIILVPTLIAGIYGMNFVHMPELRWKYGYAYALGLMLLSAGILYRMFKKRNWL